MFKKRLKIKILNRIIEKMDAALSAYNSHNFPVRMNFDVFDKNSVQNLMVIIRDERGDQVRIEYVRDLSNQKLVLSTSGNTNPRERYVLLFRDRDQAVMFIKMHSGKLAQRETFGQKEYWLVDFPVKSFSWVGNDTW